jgi:uncharacterized protein (TIRG00374 family)
MGQRVKQIVLVALKLAVPVLLLTWVLSRLDPQDIAQLRDRQKNWGLIFGSVASILAGVIASFYRWYLLVRSMGIEFRLRDAMRLGFVGYLFNFVSVGSVGGDLFKAVFIAREQPARRAEAVASVLVDRVIGLYALLALTSVAIMFFDISNASGDVQTLCRTTLIGTVIGGVVLATMMLPAATENRLIRYLSNLPAVGQVISRLMESLATVRSRPITLVKIVLMSFAVHALLAIGVIGIASALFDKPPTILEQLIIFPLSNVASGLPFTPAGLGAFELAMDELYKRVPQSPIDASGAVVAIGFRMCTILVAGIGVIIYFYTKRDVQKLLQQAEEK